MSLVSNEVNRRRLLGMLGVAGAGATASAFAPQVPFQDASVSLASGNEHSGHDAMPPASNQDAKMTADEMDAMHEAGIKAFPAETEGQGRPAARAPRWTATSRSSISPAKSSSGSSSRARWSKRWTYNGVVPGPEIRVTEGDKVRIDVTNKLPESTAIHFHGLMRAEQRWTACPSSPSRRSSPARRSPTNSRRAGQPRLAHVPLAPQLDRAGDEGAAGRRSSSSRRTRRRGPAYDIEYTMVLNDGPIGGFTLNGKGFPATEPLVGQEGPEAAHPLHE